jgi:hypothetical protein
MVAAALYARANNKIDLDTQVQECIKYIEENWSSGTQITFFIEIVKDAQNLENCKELQRLLSELDNFNMLVASQPQCLFPNNFDQYASVLKMIGNGNTRKIHYAKLL